MSREDRLAGMNKALAGLATLLTPEDRVQVIGFSRNARLLAEDMSGDNAATIGGLIHQEASEGGTNLEEALALGEQIAQRTRLEGAQNRIVLFTDGAANLGDADPASLTKRVEAMRQKGIAFDIAGIVADGLNDELLGDLARHGNGRYYVVGKGDRQDLAAQLAGAFRPAAENVKVQVHFNPERVSRYRLVGFEKDRLNKEDFRNDAVDAAEMAAEEAGVAIYQVETLPEGKGEMGEVSVRFRDVASGQMVERGWTLTHQDKVPVLDRSTPSMQLAVLAMLAGEKLKGGPLADAVNFKEMAPVAATVREAYQQNDRVAELLQMIEQLK
ncbi:MAG TPA: YfbK domain-containing protein, partial [Luteolibacter sp.]|nr:YfbK domain-containing protein [Luteolibacter sp.]